MREEYISAPNGDYCFKRIYKEILDRDWFSAHLFVTYSARDHVGVQLQVSDLSNRTPEIGYPRDFHINCARFNGFLSNVFYSLKRATDAFAQKKFLEDIYNSENCYRYD